MQASLARCRPPMDTVVRDTGERDVLDYRKVLHSRDFRNPFSMCNPIIGRFPYGNATAFDSPRSGQPIAPIVDRGEKRAIGPRNLWPVMEIQIRSLKIQAFGNKIDRSARVPVIEFRSEYSNIKRSLNASNTGPFWYYNYSFNENSTFERIARLQHVHFSRIESTDTRGRRAGRRDFQTLVYLYASYPAKQHFT